MGLSLLASLLVRSQARIGHAPVVSIGDRLSDFPKRGYPIAGQVLIHWNDHQVPYIQARTDEDLAVALGAVHAHLRLFQMEVMRRAAFGRLSEVLGPITIEIDQVLRILDVTRAVPGIAAALPDATRRWLQGFADGINHVIAQSPVRPHEFALLNFRPDPWTVEDLLGLGRLTATDFTWKVWIRILELRGRPDWIRLWQRLLDSTAAPIPSLAGEGNPDLAALDALLGGFARHGSNSFAVAGGRSTSGGALMASDPHLQIVLPNLWLAVGMNAPSYDAVGLMVPGVPAIALGRNRHIAWGGTSLHAASSDLFDLSGPAPVKTKTRTERIKVRWWRDRAIQVRETVHGPLISDAPLLPTRSGRPIAISWVGHWVSDETSALLGVNRARNWAEFRKALDGFAVPALNMTFADASGKVGWAIAAWLPKRPPQAPGDVIADQGAWKHWDSFTTGTDLPARFDPPEGYVASANDRPRLDASVAIGHFFARNDRIDRLDALLSGSARHSLETLQAFQRDVLMPSALTARDRLLALARDVPGAAGGVLAGAARWDGRYDAASRGALAFELLIYHFLLGLHGAEDLAIFKAAWDPWSLVADDLRRQPEDRLRAALAQALPAANEDYERFRTWGEMHRLQLSHVFSAFPRLGRRFRFVDQPSSGSNETVMKAAHGFSGERHSVRLGANARFLADMADPDANYVVLLGGQDGWLGSTTFLDQYPLWQRGTYIQLPLRPETARRLFRFSTVLEPSQHEVRPSAENQE